MLVYLLREERPNGPESWDLTSHTFKTLPKALAMARTLLLDNSDDFEQGKLAVTLFEMDVRVTSENFLRLMRDGWESFLFVCHDDKVTDLWDALSDEEIAEAKCRNDAEKELGEIEAKTTKKSIARGPGGKFTTSSVRTGLQNATKRGA